MQKRQLRIFGIPIWETRLSAETDSSNPAPWLYDAFGATPGWAGISVNEDTALKFSAVYGCVRVISDQLASFPKGIYKRIDDRVREKQSDHPLKYLIDSQPNEFCTAFDFWDACSNAVLLWGNGFAEILRDGRFGISGFQNYHPSKITIHYGIVDGKPILFYEENESHRVIPYYNMLHFHGMSFDGVQGKGVIANFAKESVGLSVAAEKFGAKFFGNDTMMTKYLSHPTQLSDPALKHIQESWQQNYAGLDNAFKIRVLEEGMKLENVGIPPDQAQYLGTRQHQVEEICRWFKVQPHLIQHLLRSTNNNIEHQGIEFVTQTLTPWVVRFEHELNRKIFAEREKGLFYVKFNMGSLLRGDVKTRSEYYSKMLQWGVLCPDEVRELEDRNPREDGKGGEYINPANITGKQEEKDNSEKDKEDENKAYIRGTQGYS
jgi:HK97 family phage portal protein